MTKASQVKIGTVFGELTVIMCSSAPRSRDYIEVLCSCGKQKQVRCDSLITGGTKSCGCKAGFQVVHNLTQHPLYTTWCNIRQRCFDKGSKSYAIYGGKGITIAPVFADPAVFISYIETTLGPRLPGATLDRIDNNKGYEPGNLRWATSIEQNNNRSNTVRYLFQGEERTLRDIANLTEISHKKLSNRVKLKRSRRQIVNVELEVAKLQWESRRDVGKEND